MHIKVTAKWNGTPFERVFEVEDEGDCIDHIMLWSSIAGATVSDIEMVPTEE
ncbi:hypothetical protein [Pantoea sp. UYEF8]|uniref:hypothetical protein n=1 Tax=Pantoea sp. UYEF8 TaxID=1756394 RepID=UPI0033989AD8